MARACRACAIFVCGRRWGKGLTSLRAEARLIEGSLSQCWKRCATQNRSQECAGETKILRFALDGQRVRSGRQRFGRLLIMGKGRKRHVAGATRATGRNNSKHVGEIAEMQFMLDAARRGFGVAKPFGDNERYDVIVDAPRRLWRVQVKASGARHHKGFAVRA